MTGASMGDGLVGSLWPVSLLERSRDGRVRGKVALGRRAGRYLAGGDLSNAKTGSVGVV